MFSHPLTLLASKDNIATHPDLGFPTTAGSLALLGSKPRENSHVVGLVRDEPLRKSRAALIIVMVSPARQSRRHHPWQVELECNQVPGNVDRLVWRPWRKETRAPC